MKTYLNKNREYVSYKPDCYWSGMVDINGEYIFKGDTFLILNARGHDKPVKLTCSDYICFHVILGIINIDLKYY